MSAASSANVARFLALRAAEAPGLPALMAPTGRSRTGEIQYRTLSFAAMAARTAQLAHGLEASRISRGKRVLIMVRPGLELILCCFSLFRVGAVPVVIDPGMGLRAFLDCVRRTRPSGLIAIRSGYMVSRLFRGVFQSVRDRILVGNRFESWIDTFPSTPYADCEPEAEELAAILFTSGSTGPPKGVCYGHGQFDAQVRLVRETFGIEPGEVDFPMLPVFALFNPALGMTTVVPEINASRPAALDAGRALQAIEQTGVTNSFGSPVLWDKLARFALECGQTFPKMRRVLSAGAAVPPDLVERVRRVFPRARIWSPYGATECLPVTAIEGRTILEETAEQTRRGAGICVGVPVSGVEVRIIEITQSVLRDFSEAVELAPGRIGEVVATGPSVTAAYDALPEATARAKIRDEAGRIWHRMGDAGYLDTAGRLWFCGRLSERVETVEGTLFTECCEGHFHGLPGVRRVALIGMGKGPVKEPALVVELLPGAKFDPQTLLQRAQKQPATALIKRIFHSRGFPVDVRHNAKINRLELARRHG
ncbi:MAG: hypothetical protein RL648_806 [Verrucomicrobiota bacterium]